MATRYKLRHLIALKKQRVLTRFVNNSKHKEVVICLTDAFGWSESPEGFDYWYNKIHYTHLSLDYFHPNTYMTIKQFRSLKLNQLINYKHW